MNRIEQLKRDVCDLDNQKHAKTIELASIQTKLELMTAELDTLVNQSLDEDPTLWLPNEIMVLIFLMLPARVLWFGGYQRVCHRWKKILDSTSPIERYKMKHRWMAYENRILSPKRILCSGAFSMVVCQNNNIYCLNYAGDKIYVFDENNELGMTIDVGGYIVAVAAGAANNKIYCGLTDGRIPICSGKDGTRLGTYKGHTGGIYHIVPSTDDKVYSSASDKTIRVWCDDVQVRVIHTEPAPYFAVEPDNCTIYTTKMNGCVHAICLAENTYDTTRMENAFCNTCIVVDTKYDKIYFGSWGNTIQVWSRSSKKHTATLRGHSGSITSIVLHADMVFSCSLDGDIRAWSRIDDKHLYTIPTPCNDTPTAIASRNDDMLVTTTNHILYVW